MTRFAIAALVCAAVAIAGAQMVSPDAQKHIDAARAAAGSDHMGLFQPLCDGALALAKPPAPAWRWTQAGDGRGDRHHHPRARRGTPSRSRCSTTCTTSA